jgi:hypothetical protein
MVFCIVVPSRFFRVTVTISEPGVAVVTGFVVGGVVPVGVVLPDTVVPVGVVLPDTVVPSLGTAVCPWQLVNTRDNIIVQATSVSNVFLFMLLLL